MTTAKGDHALKRDQWSAKWAHLDPALDALHPADEHYVGDKKWRCYDCGEKVVIADSAVVLKWAATPEETPE